MQQQCIGAISSTVESACQNCGIGKYSSTLAAAQESSCIDCPGGKYGAGVGLKTTNDCIDCTKGNFQETKKTLLIKN